MYRSLISRDLDPIHLLERIEKLEKELEKLKEIIQQMRSDLIWHGVELEG